MAIKTDEETLEKKRIYYAENKEKILARKHERQDIIYENKQKRVKESDLEYEKEYMRRMSKMEQEESPGACQLCGMLEKDLDFPLEKHHPDYNSTEVWWLCKRPCHVEADKLRRREK